MPETAPDQPKLTLKQQKFVDAYLGDARGNASEAARLAGYRKPGHEGWRLLKNAEIRARIDDVLRTFAMSREEVLMALADDARRSDDDILTLAKKASDRAGIPAGAAAVSSLVSARTNARTNLAKAHGLFTENLNVSGSLTREYVILREEEG